MTSDNNSSINPLLKAWTTAFETPPFAEIDVAHFSPAFESTLVQHKAEIEAIASNPHDPTFANTMEALERAGAALRRVTRVFRNLCGSRTSDELQALERDWSPRLAAHHSDIATHPALFRRIAALHGGRDHLGLNPQQLRLLERTHKAFVRAGAQLQGDAKERYKALVRERARLTTRFGQNVLADENTYALELKSETDLAGLPQFVLDAARAAATERGMGNSHAITLSRSLIEPFLTFSTRRDLREQAWRAWTSRGESGGAGDNRRLISELLAVRTEMANLLGYGSHADYALDDSMARTPARVRELLDRVWPPALARARGELAMLQARAAADGEAMKIEPWDWRYYAEKVRAAQFNLDEAAIKPYLVLENMLAAAFHTASRLFCLAFKERPDLPVYHPDVRAWEVTDSQGHHIGVFYGDYFARTSKRSGAWMSTFRDQDKLDGGRRPIVVNVMNFAKGPPGEPTLLSLDDARTLFHEFGHALHGLLSDVTYPSLSCTSVVRDFVELPSQLFEHWLDTREVLNGFARHCQTGAPMPESMVAELKSARTFNQGYETVSFLGSAIVDMDLHTQARTETLDPLALEAATLKRIGMPAEIGMRHRSPHFQHIFAGGYAAGYYSYLWSEVLDADAFAAFEETGDVFDPAIADKLKRYIYAAGGLRPEDEAYTLFRGRLPSVDGLLRKRGLN